MIQANLPSIPNDDIEARNAIIQAIILVSDFLWDQHKLSFENAFKRPDRIDRKDISSSLPTWKLFETLCILTILKNADGLASNRAPNPFEKFGPLSYFEKGKTRYLWYQSSITCNITGENVVPDILTSSNPTPQISASEDLCVIECKHYKTMEARLIRSEYGRARDLNAFSYLIWNWWTPKDRLVQIAKKLGLDLISIGIDSTYRHEFLREPHKLLIHVQGEIAKSRNNRNFAAALINTGEETRNKLNLLDLPPEVPRK